MNGPTPARNRFEHGERINEHGERIKKAGSDNSNLLRIRKASRYG